MSGGDGLELVQNGGHKKELHKQTSTTSRRLGSIGRQYTHGEATSDNELLNKEMAGECFALLACLIGLLFAMHTFAKRSVTSMNRQIVIGTDQDPFNQPELVHTLKGKELCFFIIFYAFAVSMIVLMFELLKPVLFNANYPDNE